MQTKNDNKDQMVLDLISEAYDLSPYEDHKTACLSGWRFAVERMTPRELDGFIKHFQEQVTALRASQKFPGISEEERRFLLLGPDKIGGLSR